MANKYRGDEARVNVTKEAWYSRYLQSTTDGINNFANGGNAKRVTVFGIEGHTMYGNRTRDEWPQLQADIDTAFKEKMLKIRPAFTRVKIEDLKEELEFALRKDGWYAVIASCPSRIGDDHNAMDTVRAIANKFGLAVYCSFSYAGNTASKMFKNQKSREEILAGTWDVTMLVKDAYPRIFAMKFVDGAIRGHCMKDGKEYELYEAKSPNKNDDGVRLVVNNNWGRNIYDLQIFSETMMSGTQDYPEKTQAGKKGWTGQCSLAKRSDKTGKELLIGTWDVLSSHWDSSCGRVFRIQIKDGKLCGTCTIQGKGEYPLSEGDSKQRDCDFQLKVVNKWGTILYDLNVYERNGKFHYPGQTHKGKGWSGSVKLALRENSI